MTATAPPPADSGLPRRDRGGHMASVVLGMGIVSLALLVLTRWIDWRLIQRDETLLRAVESFSVAVAASHLWLEEYVTGDEAELGKVHTNLRRADALVAGMLDGGGSLAVAKLEAPALREQAMALRRGLDAFREISERRTRGHPLGEDVGIGSAIDSEYDRVFAELFAAAAALSDTLEARLAGNRWQARVLFGAILACWTVIVGIAVAGLRSLARRRAAAERALEDSRDQLLQAQKMDAVGRLAGGLAHDINNYLGAIRAHADLIAVKLPAGDGPRDKVEAIVRVVGKASAMIDRLLAFARKQPARPRVLDPNAILREGMGSVLNRLVGDRVGLESRLADDLWLIEIDSTQFEQVVLNLVVNARDAIAAGGQIVLGTENVTVTETHAYRKDVPTPGDYVGLSVADTGSGIPAEALPKIFEPFFTTKNRAGSSGLGLATVLGIVQTNEGGIHVESKPGRGSRFTALFPRSTRSRVENVPPVAAPTLRLRPADAPAILFVENNPDLRVAVVELLEAAGYRVTAASEPAAALEMFDAARRDGSYFDLLITDIVMPGMSGKRLADRIHEEEPALPVLFLSGQPDDEPSRHEIARDYVPLLRKPFSMERLLDAIEALGEDGASRGPDAQA